jgi:hypothetical protein
MVPSPQLQEALDTSLRLATPDTRARFASNLGGVEDSPTLDHSMISQLQVAVGDLARVLARFNLSESTGGAMDESRAR